ncbi:MAG: cell wall metabolism sensor histidine kinase WalK [Bacillus sp. (in: Bacteria)]|nr:cell wall metabolism sensor histidine kinase WalK [Bacillus sp. (in: firmicutes)]
MKWINKSLFRRLLISYLFIIILGFGLIGAVITISSQNYITEAKRQEILQQATSINAAIMDFNTVTHEVEDLLAQLGQFSGSNIWLFNEEGSIVATASRQDVLGEPINEEIINEILQGRSRIEVMRIEEEERPMLSVIVPWGTNEKIHGGIVLHSPISGINSTVRSIREIVLWGIISGLIIVSFLVSYLSWTISRPLKNLDEAANEIALGNWKKRVHSDNTFPEEIDALIRSFNRMADKINKIEDEREVLEQRRTDFIANISHELRTPLTAMKGFLEALQDGLVKDPDSQQKYYEIMYRETEYLNHLVNDLMDLIKLERKEVSLDLYFVHLDEVLKKVSLNLEREMEENNNIFIYKEETKTPPIIGDSLRLEEIFKNIIHNANKFTEDGTITAELKQEGSFVVVTIADTGIGIPSYDLKRIWERFFKVDRVRSKKGRGTGLGLAIVKELVRLHEGEIEVDSELGTGTTFIIRFPIQMKK